MTSRWVTVMSLRARTHRQTDGQTDIEWTLNLHRSRRSLGGDNKGPCVAIKRHQDGLHFRLRGHQKASTERRWRQISQRPTCQSPQGVHRQCIQIPALATWLEQWPVRYGGPVTHGPFSVADRLSSPDRAPGLRHLSTLQRRWRDGRAPGAAVSSSWPGQKRHLARRSIQHGSTTPLGVPGAHWGGDPPDREWERERERERESY